MAWRKNEIFVEWLESKDKRENQSSERQALGWQPGSPCRRYDSYCKVQFQLLPDKDSWPDGLEASKAVQKEKSPAANQWTSFPTAPTTNYSSTHFPLVCIPSSLSVLVPSSLYSSLITLVLLTPHHSLYSPPHYSMYLPPAPHCSHPLVTCHTHSLLNHCIPLPLTPYTGGCYPYWEGEGGHLEE